MGLCLLPEQYFLLPQLGTEYWPRGLLCISGVEHFLPSLTCSLQVPCISTNMLASPLGAFFQEPCDRQCEMGWKKVMWVMSIGKGPILVLVLSWIESGPASFPAPAQWQKLKAFIHMVCASQNMRHEMQ